MLPTILVRNIESPSRLNILYASGVELPKTSRVKIADAVDKRYSETRFGGLTQTINE